MRFAFLGAYGTFDYFTIGGVESFARRLATGLLQQGHQADFVIYRAPAPSRQVVGAGIGLNYHVTLRKALRSIESKCDHVITLYLHPQDRLFYMLFRKLKRHRLIFHQVYFSWADSLAKRKLSFIDARLASFNGYLLCISPRQYHEVRRWCDKVILLLPPVPENYFIRPETKPTHARIKVTYIGRTEAGKGIEEVTDLLSRLKGHPEVEMGISGLHHRHVKASSQVHEWLNQQEDIRYLSTPFEGYSDAVEDNLRETLQETDILILPYQRLSSTIDTPLLLLEGMAALCTIITPPFGNIPDTYGPSPFFLTDGKRIYDLISDVLSTPDLLDKERLRIFQRNNELGFRADQVTQRLLEAVS